MPLLVKKVETMSAPLESEAPLSMRAKLWQFVSSHRFLIPLLAFQFVLVQIITGPLYGDAPRNLHWGILTSDMPSFLLGSADYLAFNKGFEPDPPSLAPRGLYVEVAGGLHPWWGPVIPVLLALIWKLTHSYLLLQSILPLCAAGVVYLTYKNSLFLWNDQKQALIAAAFLSCFPLFRDYASTSYTEAFGATILAAALFAYFRGRLVWAVLAGTLAMLTKMDLVFLYCGVIGICLLYSLYKRDTTFPFWYHIAALLIPLIISSPWIWMHYIVHRLASSEDSSFSLGLFTIIFPQMLSLLFYLPWYGSLITLAAIIAAIIVGFRLPNTNLFTKVFLMSWLLLGCTVGLVYAATPGAGNSPRIIIPSLPPMAMVFALGILQMRKDWRRRISFYLISLFTVINLVLIGYYTYQGATIRAYSQAWAYLREQPQGLVLAEEYWPTVLYTRQPTTWFEFDEAFQKNILHNQSNFTNYVTKHSIRYIIVPVEGDLVSADVKAYLDNAAAGVQKGTYMVYTLP
jgi:hypothetical protein